MTSTEDGSKVGNADGIFQATFETAGTRQNSHPLLSGVQSHIRDTSYSHSVPTTSQNTNNPIQLSNPSQWNKRMVPSSSSRVPQGQLPYYRNLSSRCLTGWCHSQKCQQCQHLVIKDKNPHMSFYFHHCCSGKKGNQFLQAAV